MKSHPLSEVRVCVFKIYPPGLRRTPWPAGVSGFILKTHTLTSESYVVLFAKIILTNY